MDNNTINHIERFKSNNIKESNGSELSELKSIFTEFRGYKISFDKLEHFHNSLNTAMKNMGHFGNYNAIENAYNVYGYPDYKQIHYRVDIRCVSSKNENEGYFIHIRRFSKENSLECIKKINELYLKLDELGVDFGKEEFTPFKKNIQKDIKRNLELRNYSSLMNNECNNTSNDGDGITCSWGKQDAPENSDNFLFYNNSKIEAIKLITNKLKTYDSYFGNYLLLRELLSIFKDEKYIDELKKSNLLEELLKRYVNLTDDPYNYLCIFSVLIGKLIDYCHEELMNDNNKILDYIYKRLNKKDFNDYYYYYEELNLLSALKDLCECNNGIYIEVLKQKKNICSILPKIIKESGCERVKEMAEEVCKLLKKEKIL